MHSICLLADKHEVIVSFMYSCASKNICIVKILLTALQDLHVELLGSDEMYERIYQ